MTLLFQQNLGTAWGTTVVTGGGSQTRISLRLIVQDGEGMEEVFE